MRIYRQVEKREKNENLQTGGKGREKNENLQTGGKGREKNVPAGGTDC